MCDDFFANAQQVFFAGGAQVGSHQDIGCAQQRVVSWWPVRWGWALLKGRSGSSIVKGVDVIMSSGKPYNIVTCWRVCFLSLV